MKKFIGSSVGRLRLVAIIEGLSWLALLLIAVPMKYLGGNEIGVKTIGPVHGGLFMLFGLFLLLAWLDRKWTFQWVVAVFVSAMIPFGFLYMDRRLKAMD